MTGYDITRMTAGAVVVEHYDAPLTLDGPWLVVQGGPGAPPLLVAPAHVVVSVLPCAGDCGADGGV